MKLISFCTTHGAPVHVGELDAETGTIATLAAPMMLDWLAGDGRERTGEEHPLAEVTLVSPLPVPASYRDFMTSELHTREGGRALLAVTDYDPSAYWYEHPAFYYGNHHAFVGPGPVAYPTGCSCLDFELEIAAVVGTGGEIAGFTLLNDFSARDIQRGEATVGLGPHKAKDFANGLGPWIVTPDELEFTDGILQLSAEVELNGEVIVSTTAEDQRFSWETMLEHAGRNTTVPAGSLLGSGTLAGGSLLETGAFDTGRWLEVGDTITLRATGLGELTNTIVAG